MTHTILKHKSEGISSRKDDLHTAGGEHIGEECRALDEVLHEGDLVDEDIFVALLFQ